MMADEKKESPKDLFRRLLIENVRFLIAEDVDLLVLLDEVKRQNMTNQQLNDDDHHVHTLNDYTEDDYKKAGIQYAKEIIENLDEPNDFCDDDGVNPVEICGRDWFDECEEDYRRYNDELKMAFQKAYPKIYQHFKN